MKILSFPIRTGVNSNPYFDQVFGNFSGDVRVRGYHPLLPWQNADILHVHWLEGLLYKRPTRQIPSLAPILFKILDVTIDRVRRSGALVWTVHNLHPHEAPPLRLQGLWSDQLAHFLSRVDVAIAMSPAQLPMLLKAYPEIYPEAWRIATHPHYRSAYVNYSPRVVVRQKLGIPSDAFLASMIGTVRRYKGIVEAIKIFNDTSRLDEYLLIAGYCRDEGLRAEILTAINGGRVIAILRPISPQELTSYYRASDLALFNFHEVLNSGSILTALSLDAPVLAPKTVTFQDIFHRIGGETRWLNLFDERLNADTLRFQIHTLRCNRPSGKPNLESFEPDLSARQHVEAYQYALSRRGKTPKT